MYPEVLCPSRLLYSIYIGREVQCNTINNYTQSNSVTIYSSYSDREDVTHVPENHFMLKDHSHNLIKLCYNLIYQLKKHNVGHQK
jgi:hypothetical protein